MPRIRFQRIIILESIPTGQPPTGRQLFDALEPIAAPVTVEYASAATRVAFKTQLQKIYDQTVSTRHIPLLHIEAHGNDDGIELANGDFIHWDDLCKDLVAINQATGFDLFVSISACFGAYLMSQVNPIERAPFSACLSATKSLYPDELFRGFYTFYRALLSGKSGTEILTAMKEFNNENDQSFYFGEASDFFQKVCAGYFSNFCTPEKYVERAKQIQELRAERGLHFIDLETTYIQLAVRERSNFEAFREKYFMLDLFPENATRFPVKFEDVRKEQN